MKITRFHRVPAPVGSILLGRSATAWGVLTLPMYLVLFVGLTSGRGAEGLPVALNLLPSLIPWIGVGLAVFGLGLAWLWGSHAPVACLVGLALNLVPLALAIVDRVLRLGAIGG